ncbi:MAG: transporter substrate-binding domain-containing protein [Octadecabacter sp.]
MILSRLMAVIICICGVFPAFAQDEPLSFATVERIPFALPGDGIPTGFSVELMRAISEQLGRDVEFEFYDGFPEMLSSIDEGLHDGAIANISITAERERFLDFSQPIFEGGIGVLLVDDNGSGSFLSALWTREILYTVVAALALLFGSGVVMWMLERRSQAYFDRKGADGLFHSFWWSLNLVVNGGFEERVPQTRLGRVFAIMLVVSSLFLVSIFVATITSTMTVEALQHNVESINDLEGRRVGTIAESTSAEFLFSRDLAYVGFEGPDPMFAALEDGQLDAIVFDAPILSYYSNATQEPATHLLPRIYRSENYGIALPTDSLMGEDINQALLSLREDGTYSDLVIKWFGNAAG